MSPALLHPRCKHMCTDPNYVQVCLHMCMYMIYVYASKKNSLICARVSSYLPMNMKFLSNNVNFLKVKFDIDIFAGHKCGACLSEFVPKTLENVP